ncbi:CLUMA_CG013935, isoform A [Clunio marinus]|uniref:CLUMA_CG013935, isoform A n=1 Tax=Clunio marinus TaxID=568069 RepID=A0A1J1IKB6_9DIPT|nr:CLUMA_CG013935, isoform A [Clunio marinus]
MTSGDDYELVWGDVYFVMLKSMAAGWLLTGRPEYEYDKKSKAKQSIASNENEDEHICMENESSKNFQLLLCMEKKGGKYPERE